MDELIRPRHTRQEGKTMEGLNTDKVNINVGGGEGGGGGAGLAAVIAALGNRNQGGDNAALIAALGNRNDSDPATLAAIMNGRRGDDGMGMGGLWPIILLALLGRRGGFGGGGDDCDGVSPAQAALLQSLVEGQADLRASVPTSALETTNALQNVIAQLALGVQQGFANVKDSVQAAAALNLSATQGVAKDVATGTLQNVIAIGNDGDKTRALITQFNTENLQRELTVAQTALSEERLHRHNDGVEVRVNQNVNQQQAQVQTQRIDDARFAHLHSLIASIGNQVLNARTAQDIVNLGTMTASGTQTPTSVNQRN